MDWKLSVFVICVEAIVYLLLYNLHDCTFKSEIKIIPCQFRILNPKSFRVIYPKYLRNVYLKRHRNNKIR